MVPQFGTRHRKIPLHDAVVLPVEPDSKGSDIRNMEPIGKGSSQDVKSYRDASGCVGVSLGF